MDFSNDIIPPLAHLTYDDVAEVLFYHIQSQADTTFILKYDGVDNMITLQHLHISDLLTHDGEGVDENGPNDIEYIRMLPGQPNNDFAIGGSAALQQRICALLTNYRDIFSCNVKGKAMSVPHTEFTVDAIRWEAPAIRLPSRYILVESMPLWKS